MFEYRIVSFEYFMEEMSISQAYMCANNIKWTDLNFKTIMRYQIWSLYNSNAFGKNKNEIQDIMTLPWDDEDTKHTIATDKELEEQKKMMEEMEKMMETPIIEEKFMI